MLGRDLSNGWLWATFVSRCDHIPSHSGHWEMNSSAVWDFPDISLNEGKHLSSFLPPPCGLECTCDAYLGLQPPSWTKKMRVIVRQKVKQSKSLVTLWSCLQAQATPLPGLFFCVNSTLDAQTTILGSLSATHSSALILHLEMIHPRRAGWRS